MKLLLLVVPRELRDDAEAALEEAAGAGFTEIPGVYGEGSTGPRFGSRQAPGVSDLVFAALADGKLAGGPGGVGGGRRATREAHSRLRAARRGGLELRAPGV